MKKRILPLLIVLITLMTSCSSVFDIGYICILNTENGTISVTKEKGSDAGVYNITATPDDGYFITKKDVNVEVDNRRTYRKIIEIAQIDTNQFQFRIDEGDSVIVSAVFRKIVQ